MTDAFRSHLRMILGFLYGARRDYYPESFTARILAEEIAWLEIELAHPAQDNNLKAKSKGD